MPAESLKRAYMPPSVSDEVDDSETLESLFVPNKRARPSAPTMPSSSSGAPAAQHHPKTTHPTKPFIIDLSGNAKVSIPDASDKTLPTAAQPKIMNKSKENRILLGKCRNQFRTMISGLEEVKLRVMKAKGELDKEAGQLKNDIEVLNQKSKVVKEKQLEKVEKLDKLDEEISSLKDMHRQLEGELVNKLWK